MINNRPEYLRVSLVAKILNVSTRHIYNLIDSGDIIAVNIGRSKSKPTFRINKDDLQAFIRKNES